MKGRKEGNERKERGKERKGKKEKEGEKSALPGLHWRQITPEFLC
jgi:hypothetical protein